MLCTHKTTILCQFGLFLVILTTITQPILIHFWWELYQMRASLSESTPERLDSNISTISNGTLSLPCAPSVACVVVCVVCVVVGSMLGFGCDTPNGAPLLPPPLLGVVKSPDSYPSSVTWAKRWMVQQSNSSVCWSFGG